MHTFCLNLVDIILLALFTIISPSLCRTTCSSNPLSHLPAIPLPHQYLNFGIFKPVEYTRNENAFRRSSVLGAKPHYFDVQNYAYRHPGELTRLLGQNRHAEVIEKPPKNPVHIQNYDNFNSDRIPDYPNNGEKYYDRENDKPELYMKIMPAFKPQQRENTYSQPDFRRLRNYDENIKTFSNEIDTSTEEFSTPREYTATDNDDYETTTPVDELGLRIGPVPVRLAASLIGG